MAGPAAPPRDATFALELPAEPPFLASARVFAAVIARQAGCAEAVVDDVKLAVSEAWASLVGREPVGSIRVGVVRAGGRLRIELGRVGGPSAPPGASTGQPWPEGIELVRLLFEDVEVLEDGRGALVRFSVPLDR